MSVQELIEELQAIEDKTKRVVVSHYDSISRTHVKVDAHDVLELTEEEEGQVWIG